LEENKKKVGKNAIFLSKSCKYSVIIRIFAAVKERDFVKRNERKMNSIKEN